MQYIYVKKLILMSTLVFNSNGWAEDLVEMAPGPFFAIVDVETTGLDPNYNEIIDIGLILILSLIHI